MTSKPTPDPLLDQRSENEQDPQRSEAREESATQEHDTYTPPADDPVARLLASSRPQSATQRLVTLGALLLIGTGIALAIWAISNIPGGARSLAGGGDARAAVAAAPTETPTSVAPTAEALLEQQSLHLLADETEAQMQAELAATATPAARAVGLHVGLPVSAPSHFLRALGEVVLEDGSSVAAGRTVRDRPVYFDWKPREGQAVYTMTVAAAERFDTIFPAISLDALEASWAGDTTTYTVISVLTPTIAGIEAILGPAGVTVQGQETITDVVAATWQFDSTDEGRALALVPFDELRPDLVVLPVDGINPVENTRKFDTAAYPLVATLYAHVQSTNRAQVAQVDDLLAALPAGNREASHLTTLTMTGVTAMVRMMADEMDRRGAAWPAEHVGEELSSADITHISNEVPWVDDCETDLRMDNFNFCTKTEYMETLRLVGVDIIGLTGNHQNDFGRSASYKSLDYYEEEGWPVYGGGRDLAAAQKPLYVEHNGNRIAFLGANSYGPEMAWADGNYPGSAPFDLAVLSATIRNIKTKNLADLVLVELQYQESYGTEPLHDQRDNFNALVRAGADIVTGVQSHVPQAMEFTDGKLILYGLGNLFFDQMFNLNTRENLVVKHTIYEGRHISTQVMTTMLHDFGQPQWMTDDERASLLRRVFAASFWEH